MCTYTFRNTAGFVQSDGECISYLFLVLTLKISSENDNSKSYQK